MNDMNMGAEPAREMPPIDQALRVQSRELEALVDEVSDLIEAISPILTPTPTVEDGVAEDKALASPLTNQINSNTAILAYQVRRLNTVRHYVEL